MQFLIKIYRDYLKRITLLYVLMFVSIFFQFLNPYLFRIIIDQIIPSKNIDVLFKVLSLVVSILVVYLIINSFAMHLRVTTREKILYDMRLRLYNNVINNLDFDLNDIGEYINKFISEIPIIVDFLIDKFPNVLASVVSIVFSLIILLTLDVYLTIICLVTLFALMLFYYLVNPKVKIFQKNVLEGYSDITNILQDNYNNYNNIKFMRIFDFAESRLIHTLENVIRINYKVKNFRIVYTLVSILLNFIPQISIFIIGAYKIINSSWTIGELVQYFSFYQIMQNSLLGLNSTNLEFQSIMATIKRYEKTDVLDEINLKDLNVENVYNLSYVDITKEFDGVCIFRHLNLNFITGEIIRIEGANGVGKSTLLKLLSLSYNFSGKVLINNEIDIKNLENNFFTYNVGIVTQQSGFFSENVRTNILCGRSFTDNDIIDFYGKVFKKIINSKYLDKRIIQLSSGERQCVLICRALLSDPQLIIFDEAFIHLDSITLNNLISYIKNIKNDKIIIIVTHKELDIDYSQIINLNGGMT